MIAAHLLAFIAVLPLLVLELWVGFGLGLSDTALSVIAPTEQPLSVRSPGGPWAIILALAWFGLAYWRRKFAPWEAVLVLIGGVAILARLGNAWVDAVALLVPLARQLALANFKPVVMGGLAAICLAVALVTVATSRPPDLPAAASAAAVASASQAARATVAVQAARATVAGLAAGHGKVMADWRWAGELQRGMGAARQVWASGGLASETTEYWLDYLRVAQGHAQWAEILRQRSVDLVVLDAAGQQRQAADLVRASPGWRVTFDADGVLVAERVGS